LHHYWHCSSHFHLPGSFARLLQLLAGVIVGRFATIITAAAVKVILIAFIIVTFPQK